MKLQTECTWQVAAPWRLFVFLLASIFVVEAGVMFLLPLVQAPDAGFLSESLLDAIRRTLLVAPLLWWLVVMPLRTLVRIRAQLLQRVFSFQEEEQRRIAIDLHDGLGQPLTGVLVALRAIEETTTDGQHLWVVNDTPKGDMVIRYSVAGRPEGNWRIDPANPQPTGLTIDPNDVEHLWIVDAHTDAVYRYADGAARVSGAQAADAVFALAAGNCHPQGIADPKPASPTAIGLPPRELLNQPTATPVGPNRTFGDGNRAARSSVDVHRTNAERIGAAVSTRPNLDRHDRAPSEWIEDAGRSGALVNDLADTLDCLARSQVHRPVSVHALEPGTSGASLNVRRPVYNGSHSWARRRRKGKTKSTTADAILVRTPVRGRARNGIAR